MKLTDGSPVRRARISRARAHSLPAPFVLKPRRGSDSIGVRLVGDVPPGKRDEDTLVQERIVGVEVTVALFRERVGMPLRILLPPGTPYSFLRKYLWRPAREVLRDEAIRDAALAAGRALGVDWAARVDFIVRDGQRLFWNATPRRSWTSLGIRRELRRGRRRAGDPAGLADVVDRSVGVQTRRRLSNIGLRSSGKGR
jgi:hypothetical protein